MDLIGNMQTEKLFSAEIHFIRLQNMSTKLNSGKSWCKLSILCVTTPYFVTFNQILMAHYKLKCITHWPICPSPILLSFKHHALDFLKANLLCPPIGHVPWNRKSVYISVSCSSTSSNIQNLSICPPVGHMLIALYLKCPSDLPTDYSAASLPCLCSLSPLTDHTHPSTPPPFHWPSPFSLQHFAPLHPLLTANTIDDTFASLSLQHTNTNGYLLLPHVSPSARSLLVFPQLPLCSYSASFTIQTYHAHVPLLPLFISTELSEVELYFFAREPSGPVAKIFGGQKSTFGAVKLTDNLQTIFYRGQVAHSQ